MENKKKRIFTIALICIVLCFSIVGILAAGGIYVYEMDKNTGIMKASLMPFNANGELNIGNEEKQIYLGVNAKGDPINYIGKMKDVKIKQQADGIFIEFKEAGSLSLRDSVKMKFYDYKDIKSGGRFYFNSNGELIKSYFESTKQGSYYLNGNYYEVKSNTKLGSENKKTSVSIKEGNLNYYNENDAENKKSFDSLRNGEFEFDENGKLIQAGFNVEGDSEYSFGNKKIKAPKNSEVTFKDDRVTIKLPDNQELVIEKPVKIPDSKDADVRVEYVYSDEVSKIKIRDNDREYELSKLGNNKFQLNYDEIEDAFFVDGDFDINKLRVGEKTNKDVKNYLFFDGEEHKTNFAYLSLGDKKLIIGAAAGSSSPSVQFLEGNSFFNIDGNKVVILQKIGGTEGGKLVIENIDEDGKIPYKITSTGGGYIMIFGKQALHYTENFKDKYNGPMFVESPFKDSTDSNENPLIHVVTLDSSENRVDDWDVVTTKNGISVGNAEELEKGLVSMQLGNMASLRANFHSLTKEEQSRLRLMSLEKQRELVSVDADTLREEIKKLTPNVKLDYSGVTSKNKDILASVERLTSSRDSGGGDLSTKIHEEVHFANYDRTAARGFNSDYSPRTDGYRVFLEGFDDNGNLMEVAIRNTGIRKAEAYAYLSKSLWQATAFEQVGGGTKSFYDTYLLGVHANKDAVHAFEDISAYTLETEGKTLESYVVGQIMAASLQPALVGMMLQDRNPGYLDSKDGEQFKAYLAKSLETSMEKYAQLNSNPSMSGVSYPNNVLYSIRTAQDMQNFRNFLIKTYGESWTQRVLGF
ncbi:hypothetical protein J4218_01460 [Candidatus Pacearchaeota archaeon]|nr:hypothetical protein [Candidatus Pacearchaeota archaeon]